MAKGRRQGQLMMPKQLPAGELTVPIRTSGGGGGSAAEKGGVACEEKCFMAVLPRSMCGRKLRHGAGAAVLGRGTGNLGRDPVLGRGPRPRTGAS